MPFEAPSHLALPSAAPLEPARSLKLSKGYSHRYHQDDVDARDDEPWLKTAKRLGRNLACDKDDLLAADDRGEIAQANDADKECNLSRQHLPTQVGQDDVPPQIRLRQTDR